MQINCNEHLEQVQIASLVVKSSNFDCLEALALDELAELVCSIQLTLLEP